MHTTVPVPARAYARTLGTWVRYVLEVPKFSEVLNLVLSTC
eukprot:SAG31_NODE_15526_length_757_cov_1.253456_1_plen_40_part_10